MFAALGDELVWEVLSKLEPEERRAAAPVCRLWGDLVRQSHSSLLLDFHAPWQPDKGWWEVPARVSSLVAAVAARRQQLTTLLVSNPGEEGDRWGVLGFLILGGMPALTTVVLNGQFEAPTMLFAARQLRCLSLSPTTSWPAELGCLVNLRQLDLDRMRPPIMPSPFYLPASITQLRQLVDFSSCCSDNSNGDEKLRLRGLWRLQQLPALRRVALCDAVMADLTWVEGLTQITSLQLDNSFWRPLPEGQGPQDVLGEEEYPLDEVEEMNAMRDRSDPDYARFSEQQYDQALRRLTQLRRLELSDAGLSHLPASIAGMSRLEALVARRLGMEWGVDGCWQPKTEAHPAGYRNEQLPMLTGLQQLRELDLRGSALAWAAPAREVRRLVTTLPSLHTLRLPCCVLPKSLAALAADNPGVHIMQQDLAIEDDYS